MSEIEDFNECVKSKKAPHAFMQPKIMVSIN